ncbi:MAG: ATP-binding cassette domain-containing protein [Gemmatimonadaceae bacterium]|nr:ATP-binding cassette domain-containing protein [Gemmatimonadaceae bacterium]
MSTPSSAPADLAVQTSGLTRRFDELVAVDGIDLAIVRGSIFGLLGPNSAGKSTTIKILTTLLEPSAGSARVAGFDVRREPKQVRRCIGYVPQLLSADGALTGYENLMLSAKLYAIPRAERAERINDSLSFMGLQSSSRALVKTYSGGMVRRLELAQAMLHHPIVLFLDEPTVGLDPVARHAVWERLLESRTRYDITVLITTHDMEEADELCDRLAIMQAGRIAAEGSPEELKLQVGPNATLDEVFAHFGVGAIDEGGRYRDVRNARRTASRLG